MSSSSTTKSCFISAARTFTLVYTFQPLHSLTSRLSSTLNTLPVTWDIICQSGCFLLYIIQLNCLTSQSNRERLSASADQVPDIWFLSKFHHLTVYNIHLPLLLLDENNTRTSAQSFHLFATTKNSWYWSFLTSKYLVMFREKNINSHCCLS